MGDKITYGYFVTGHGKAAGNYARLSWQDNSASGNPAANQGCGACHDLASHHFSNAAKRLKSGYENNAGNANCNQCHKQGAAAVADPQWFTSNADYQNSAHRGKKCTDCHDVHGTIGPYAGMTRAPRENLCFQCHTEGGVQNNTISGGAMANDIQQAFSLLSKHSLGATFTVSGQSYSLQCISCHNVHVVSGKFSEAATGKSPVSRFTDNLKAWGVSAGQKMADYDISGLYQTPSGDTPTGVQLPDYATFCSDCHNNVPANTLNSPALGRTIYPFSWRLEKHGSYLGSDYASLGELLAPYADGQMGSYGLSCTDCHEAHGSSNNYLVRTQVNNGNVSVTQNGSGNNNREWDSLCFRCHGPVQSVKNIHHSLGRTCSDCHVSFMDSTSKNCAICHSHGSAEMESDTVAPVASNLSPAYGAVNVAANTSLTLTLTDTKSGIDWSTLIINLEGNKGYAWSHYIYASPEVTKSAGSGPGVLNVTLTPNTAFGSVEVITVTAVVSDYAGNVMSAPVWSFTTRDLTLPSAAPVIGTPNSLSANSIRWNFTDTAATEDGFRVHDASHAVKAFQETPNVGYVDETGLSPNTEYARHVHAYNFTGDSPESAPVSAYTLPAAPNVTADKTVATWYTTPNVVFTNAAGFGTGGVQYYRYVWDQNATYAFNDTETHWSGGTLTKASTADGSWYLHLKSYSAVHASGGVQHFGPYRYDGMPPPEVTQIDPYVSYQVTPPLHSIYVYWYSVIDSGSGTAGYSIERAPDSSGSPGTFAEIMTWPAGGNTYIIDSGLSPNTKYWYRIRAYDNTAQYGAYSNYKSAVTYSAVPTSVTASDGTAATVNISWTHDGASSSYAVLRDGPYGSGTLIYTGAATSCQDVVTGTHTYYLYSRNSSGVFSAGYATDTGYSMAGLPTAPTMGVPSNVTTNSMRWNFTDNASNEIGFRLHNSVDTVIVEQATTNLSYLDETSMTANRLYNRHVHAYNAVGDSVGSAVSSRWTLSVAPNVTADKTTSTWYTTPNVVFTNAAGFGAGGLQYYRYVWNQNATYTFNNTETQWSSGTLTMTSTADGSWYLHVKSFNGENVANGTQSYGPFYYDGAAPAVSGLTPSNGAVIVPTNSTVKFTLSDPASGINWSTFTLQLSGSKGYSISYNSSSPQVTKTGTAAQYNVTVTPDASFSTSEVITVILSTSDAVGNALSSYAYSFTTAAGSVAILHPSGLNAALGAGLWNAFGQWATYLDSNDGGMTWVYIPGGSGVSAFYVDMDNLGSCSGVMNIRLSAYVSPTLGGTNPYNLPADFDIGYKTGTNLVWSGTTTIPANTSGYSLAQSPVYSTNSDGGALTCSDVNNLVVGFKRLTGMGNQDMVTEVYVEVVYNP
ncbi:MAG: hypothetical protein A2521_11895 [Deltaproteobacteria bacterium RIFOXYD12_FULL_57_12]|nr:MAG: hypothetical protein A2521_11895 [Deltaproteobacteria bacterium RIFOXYD12_FULL_57_12]